jgi:hypothetical protein
MRMMRGIARGYLDAVRFANSRSPVDRRAFSLARELRRRGSMTLDEASEQLAPSSSRCLEAACPQ